MLSSRKFRFSLAGVGLLLLVAVVWCAWTIWQVNNDLQDAVDDADAFQAAVEAGDAEAIERELAALRDSSASAADSTSGPTWSFLTKVPVFGDDAQGVRTVSRVVHDLSQDGLEPLIAVEDQLDDLLPQDGAIPVDGIGGLAGPVAQAEEALITAESDLAAEDTSGYIGRLEDQYSDLEDRVSRAADAMTSARIAVGLMPGMLGQDGERNYLLVFQNNAEIRATGGLPGSVALLRADGGRIEMSRQIAIGTFGRSEEPVRPITPAERKLYDDVPASFFQSANMMPDVPRAADLMRARWEQEFPADRIDGVILVDTVTLAYVLDSTGPITVDGVELNGDNVVDELLHNVYLRYETNAEQDAFFGAVTEVAFDRFTSGDADGAALIKALARAADERRVYLHSFDSQEQSQLTGTAIGGEFVTDPDVTQPQLAVTLNDTTGAKMSYFLRYEVEVHPTYCTDGVQGFRGKMRLRSTATEEAKDLPELITGPLGYTAPGNQWVTVRIYGPAGGSVGDATLNDKPLNPISVDQDGRPVAMFYAELEPGETVDVAWTMKSGHGQTDDADLEITPTIVESDTATSLDSACR